MSTHISPITTPVEGKEFACSFCHREFRRLEHLQRHTRRHTHEKPFSCSCGAAFSRRDLLRRHERMIHGLFNNASQESANGPRLTDLHAHSAAYNHLSPRGQSSRYIEHPSIGLSLPAQSRARVHTRAQQGSVAESTPLRSRFAELDQLLGAQDESLLDESPDDSRHISEGANYYAGSIITPPVEVDLPVIADTNRQNIQHPHQQATILPAPPIALGAQIVPHVSHPIVTEYHRDRLLQALNESTPRGVTLPSSDALTRFLAGYFTGFYPHMPFTHAPTFKVESCSIELCLAMFALGAANRYEYSSAVKLFYLSKVTLMDRQRHRTCATIERLAGREESNSVPDRDYLDELRCLLCLGWFSTWQKEKDLREESLMLRGALAQTLRLSGLGEMPHSQVSWETWTRQETARRTKLLAFCFLNIQSIAFDLPPIIWSHELNVRLPCACPEWTAPDSTTWNLLRNNIPCQQGNFQDGLGSLLKGEHEHPEHFVPTPVANYVLLHGLIQGILWTPTFPKVMSRIPPADNEALFRNALRRWTIFWQRTPESNLEPLDPNGPLPFTSSSLLSLAYIRNCSCITGLKSRNLESWDSIDIAKTLDAAPPGNREWNELLAAQHASHILAILTKLGIQYVKNNQALVWNIEAALCGFECAIFLRKWLRGLEASVDDKPLSEPEQLLLHWIQDIMSEGLTSIGRQGEASNLSQLNILADRVVEVWSDIMRGNSPWTFIGMLGEVLVEYRRA
ncbi:hypothetical protein P170DRAFT_402401 [Aspergillus steynii IBT 23096]|uniref:C2H2-type domain-containing protein n=1 Tax=Aspergillus steynii IBT 23096 TaxID=1392250 RepID=A0A2I2GHG3_9EURO|nr:uncharacterized protein P170DRAFT_402401 [Aspergillus steynii IBT 23096]PLB52322.1 hypothetical protein P170DRAFT_402401 [Aspergillus steynii IBT 23096]